MHTLCNLFSTFPCWSWTMTLQKYKIKRNLVDGFVFSSFYATDHWFEWKGKNDVEDDEKQNSIESIFWVSRNFIFPVQNQMNIHVFLPHTISIWWYTTNHSICSCERSLAYQSVFFSIYKRILNRYVSL